MIDGAAASFVPPDAVTPRFVDAWRDLVARAAEANVFAEPETVLPAFRHLVEGSRVGLLTVGDERRLEAVLPVAFPLRLPVARSRTVPVPVLQAWVEPYQVLGTPLLDAADPVAAMSALLRPPARIPAAALLLRYFPEEGPAAAALDAALAARGQAALRTKTYQRAALLSDGPEPSSNQRGRYRRLRRQWEATEAALGPVQVRDRSGDPAAVEDFLLLESAGWKGREGTALASRATTAAWFREVCDGLRAAGRLEVLSVEAGDRILAMAVNFGAGQVNLQFKNAYDESFAEHRPGQQVIFHMLEAAPTSQYRVVDSATVPDNALLNQLWPGRLTLSTVVVPLRGPLGAAGITALRTGLGLRARAGAGRRATCAADQDRSTTSS